MIKLIFYILLIYIIYKALVFFVKLLGGTRKSPNIKNDIHTPRQNSNNYSQGKKDIEEADYREIKDDDDKS